MTASPDPSNSARASPADLILAWYRRNARSLPWRAPYGAQADPYRVWLSEIMLQQTTVGAVIPYFQKFTALWPTVSDLAAAELDDVLREWAGLGYYARARNLHKCARTIAQWRGGRFPEDEKELLDLPGIGAYTAAAITAIAWQKRAVVVDGNVERVMARLFAITDPLPGSKAQLKEKADLLTPQDNAGDYAQAVMDLGATLCSPRKPACGLCPWVSLCQGRVQGIAESLPAKTPKPEKPTRRGVAFWLRRKDGAFLLRRRAEEGLLGGMMEVPSTPWREDGQEWSPKTAIAHAPTKADWQPVSGQVRHTFTHFHLELTLMSAVLPSPPPIRGIWVMPEDIGDHALPTLMRKVVRHARKIR